MSQFDDLLQSRSAAVYADFLLPHLADGFRVLDVGCGPGSITIGLASEIPPGQFVGIDAEDDFAGARGYAAEHGIGNGIDRAGDCGDTRYRRDAIGHGLATQADLDEMRRAWLEWSTSPDAYAAFAWCRALGRKPA